MARKAKGSGSVGDGDRMEWLGVLREEHKAQSKRELARRVKQFFALYGGECRLNAGEAAKKAGYAWGETIGCKLKRRYPRTTEVVENGFLQSLSLQPNEIHEHLTAIARDPGHKDRFRALELAAKIHGMTSDKLQITMTRNQLLSAVDEEIAAILASQKETESADT